MLFIKVLMLFTVVVILFTVVMMLSASGVGAMYCSVVAFSIFHVRSMIWPTHCYFESTFVVVVVVAVFH